MFRATNGVWVRFVLSDGNGALYETEHQSVKRRVEWHRIEDTLIIPPDPNDPTEKIRITAVEEFCDHEHQKFLSWLERHPEMKKYA